MVAVATRTYTKVSYDYASPAQCACKCCHGRLLDACPPILDKLIRVQSGGHVPAAEVLQVKLNINVKQEEAQAISDNTVWSYPADAINTTHLLQHHQTHCHIHHWGPHVYLQRGSLHLGTPPAASHNAAMVHQQALIMLVLYLYMR